mgnify:FL=1
MKKLIFSALVATAICISSCSKDGDGGGGSGSGLPGTLYVDFATDGIQSYNFSNGKLSKVVKTMNGPGITGCDITYGSQEIALAISTDPSRGTQDTQTFLLRPWDGSHVWFAYDKLPKTGNTFSFSFTYDPKEFYKECIIRLSPNKKFIAVDSYEWDERGVLLLNTETGKLIADFTKGLTRDDLGYQSTPVWTENNEMYSAIKGVLYRWKEGYGDRVEEVLTLNEGKGASYVTVNPQGTRVAFRYNKHLWVQNIDGSNLHQVTTSQLTGSNKADGEYHPVFSPDGKYIALVGAPTVGRAWTDYDPLQPSQGGVVVTSGGYGYVFVIRDDGKLYDLENDKSGFIVLRQGGGIHGVPSYFSGMMWR